MTAIDTIMEEGIHQQVYPGAVVIVGQPGHVLHARAYGRQTYAPDAPQMRMDTIFDLASVSKVVGTTSATLLLVQDGRLSLDDPVSRYIPGFEADGKAKTCIWQLLTHTSGLIPYLNPAYIERSRKPGEAPADAIIRRVAALPADYQPGTQTRYSCLNMQTLARVIETASGERMEDLLHRRVFGPLGMKDTGYTLSESKKHRCAPTWIDPSGEAHRGLVHDPLARYHECTQHTPGNAGLFSTGPDLARFCQTILQDGSLDGTRIFESWALHRATSVQTSPEVSTERGLGWGLYTEPPYAPALAPGEQPHVIGHTGYTGTRIWMDLKTRTYLLILTNCVYPPKGQHEGDRGALEVLNKRVMAAVVSAIYGSPAAGGQEISSPESPQPSEPGP